MISEDMVQVGMGQKQHHWLQTLVYHVIGQVFLFGGGIATRINQDGIPFGCGQKIGVFLKGIKSEGCNHGIESTGLPYWGSNLSNFVNMNLSRKKSLWIGSLTFRIPGVFIRPWWVIWVFLPSGVFQAHAQLQIQMTPFGSNQRQKVVPNWQFLESGPHRIYYPVGLEHTADWVHKVLPSMSSNLEQQFNVRPEQPYQLLIYRSHLEWQESNLNREKLYYNTGWNFPAPGNKVPVCADQFSASMVAQIREGIVRILIAEIVYGGNSFERIQNRALLVLPSWFTEGLARYWGSGWTASMDQELREWLRGRTKPRYGELVRQRPELAGVLFWHRYIRINGSGSATQLLLAARSQRQVQSAFRSLNKETYGAFVAGILAEYQTETARDSVESALVRDALEISELRGVSKGRIRLDSKGKNIAFVAYQRGRYRVYVYERGSKKLTEVYRSSFVRAVGASSFPVLAWHPGGQRLVVIGDFGQELFLTDVQKQPDGRWIAELQVMKELDWVQSLDWSQDGRTLVVAGLRGNHSRLLACSLSNKKWRLLLMDSLEKMDIRFAPGSQSVVYAYTVPMDSFHVLRGPSPSIRQIHGISRLDLNPISKPIRLFESDSEVIASPLPLQGGKLLWLSDRSGYRIRFMGRWDDTAHIPEALPPVALNLAWHEAGILSNQLIVGNEVLTTKATLGYRDRFDSVLIVGLNPETIPISSWRKDDQRQGWELRSKSLNPGMTGSLLPANLGLMNLWTSEASSPPIQVGTTVTSFGPSQDAEGNTSLGLSIKKLFASRPQSGKISSRRGSYVRSSALDNVSMQAGNNILMGRMPLLSASPLHMLHAQPGAVMRLSLSDVPEDRILSAGALLLQSLTNFQTYLLYENLKSLIDWRLMGVYSMLPVDQPYNNPGFGRAPTGPVQSMLELYASTTYPISRSIGFSVIMGHMASVDRGPLNPDFPKGNIDITEHCTGIRFEAMCDQSKQAMGWTSDGFLLKVFHENYLFSGGRTGSSSLGGMDARSYTGLISGLVWANRLSFQYSYGPTRASYMAGGVEQWLSPRFNGDMPRPSRDKVLMYALAAPVKGLPINTRNGSAFLSVGSELRLAFSALRSAIPVGSDFWRSLRVYGFADAATVWNRGQFMKNDSTLFPTQITHGPVRVDLVQGHSPILWSYGLGLRANVLGYSLRVDRAWPWENGKALPPAWVISLGLDF